MNSVPTSDRIKHERRQFFGLAAGAIAVIPLGKSIAARAQTASMKATSLPIEGEMPSLTGATEWINTSPLTPADLRGKVVLVEFWTYTCINWLRSHAHVRAWAEKYNEHGLVVIGAHTPEFPFEGEAENVRRAVQDMKIHYPIAVDSDYAIWRAFQNNYWPAFYLVDSQGRIRHHQFGEGSYEQSEMIIQRLLVQAGSAGIAHELTSVNGRGIEAAADWADLRSPENYLGYDRAENFSSTGGAVLDKSHGYVAPTRLALNQWALSGDWTMESGFAASDVHRAYNLWCGTAAMHAVGFFHTGEESGHGRAVSFETSPAFRSDSMQFLPAVAVADPHMAEFLEQGQGRIDNPWAWAVGAADLLLDRLDDLVTVARLFGDEVENDQTKVAATLFGEVTVRLPRFRCTLQSHRDERRLAIAMPIDA